MKSLILSLVAFFLIVGFNICKSDEDKADEAVLAIKSTNDKPLTDNESVLAEFWCNESMQDAKYEGISLNSDIGKEVWGLRQAHGIALTFASLFFIPWNNFNTRYMKETFIEEKPIYISTHMHLSLNILGAISAGFVTGVWARTFFGYSLSTAAYIHTIIGWISAFIFCLTLLSSGIRLEAMKSCFCCILPHFLGRIFHYALCLLSMLTSCSIPGSPSSSAASDSAKKPHTFKFELIVWVTLGWILFDLVINLLMMELMKRSYSKMELGGKQSSSAGLLPVPSRDLHSLEDTPGSKLRKIVHVVHVLVGLVISVLVSYNIYFSSSKNRFFGRMSYTHTKGGSLEQVWKNAGCAY